MTRRSLLRRQIAEAFRRSVERDYVAQRINSERSLQASVWAQLNTILPPERRRMFIEPRMSVVGGGLRFPDIVICSARMVIGIVELKYKPRGRMHWRKDLGTFQWIASNRNSITIANSRFRGVIADGRSYSLAKDVLYVWAGVHVACDLDLSTCIEPTLTSMFLALHAETHEDGAVTFR